MSTQQRPGNYIKILTLLHAAMLTVQLLFCLVVIYLVQTNQATSQDVGNPFPIVVTVMGVAGLIATVVVPRQMLNSVRKKNTLTEKLRAYQALTLVRYALIEVPTLLSIICYMITGQYLFLALALFMIVIFVLIRPTRTGVITDLELNPADRALLNDTVKKS